MVRFTAMAAHYTKVEFGTKTELPENYRNILKFPLGQLVCNDVVFGRALGVAILIGVAGAVAVILARSDRRPLEKQEARAVNVVKFAVSSRTVVVVEVAAAGARRLHVDPLLPPFPDPTREHRRRPVPRRRPTESGADSLHQLRRAKSSASRAVPCFSYPNALSNNTLLHCKSAMAASQQKKKSPRNPELIRGVGKYSRSKIYHRRGLWAIKAKNGGAFPRHDKKPAAAAAVEKPPKFYPADDVRKPLVNKHKPKQAKLRASITPGTVLIILAGRFKGKRVVFLKQLPSGLLLVTGPFKINGVPLRRVNQAYVIGTSTKIDEKNVISQEKKDEQKAVDAALIKAIEAVPDFKAYLGARFSLKAGMKPHELVF
nr:60S ribosomal protein L6-like [Ipomoea batatas]